MHALTSVPRTNWRAGIGRAFERERLVQDAGADWLRKQGERSGYTLIGEPVVTGYTYIPIERTAGRHLAGFLVLNFAGEIEVREPDSFLEKLAAGFGGAKAFGNGLMLIRRRQSIVRL
jgi:CRISPR system Cascade subunit CasE